MKTICKLFLPLLVLGMLFALSACGDDGSGSAETDGEESVSEAIGTEETEEQTQDNDSELDNTETVQPVEEAETISSETDTADENVLVVYFSATGTTKGVAEMIAAITGGDIYEIKAAQEYTSDDLNWNDPNSRTTHEQNDSSVRPEIGSEPVSLEGYSTIYIGYPIWWGEEPRILDTFVESYGFDGITMIPFCTSSSSGVGRSGQNLADHAGSGTWLDGQRFGAGASEAEIQSWIDGLQ